MKLSEAMREGAQIRGQCSGVYFGNFGSLDYLSCAIGAVIEGAGLMTPIIDANEVAGSLVSQALPGEWPEIHEGTICPDDGNCPHAGGERLSKYRSSLLNVILHLNDDHKWTREKIADWLESKGD